MTIEQDRYQDYQDDDSDYDPDADIDDDIIVPYQNICMDNLKLR